MLKQLPARPNLDQLKIQAKELVKSVRARNHTAIERIRESHPEFSKTGAEEITTAKFSLHEAQLVVAREHGFASWAKLKTHTESLGQSFEEKVDAFIEASCPRTDENHKSGSIAKARDLLAREPRLAQANIFTASILGEVEAIEQMLKSDSTLATTEGGPRHWSPLLYLCFSRFLRFDPEREENMVRTVKCLLQHDANPNSFFMSHYMGSDWKDSALYGATGVANNPSVANLLLEAGADPNDGESLYHSCEHIDDHRCLKLLLERKLEKNSIDACFFRKLDYEDPEGVRLFLDHGANPNWAAEGGAGLGMTALHWAIRNERSVGIIELLLKYGASPDSHNKAGRTAYQMAMRVGNVKVAETLIKHGANRELSLTDQFLAACGQADRSMVQKILATEPTIVKSLPAEDMRLITDAASFNRLETVRVMIEAGFDINAKGDFGTPVNEAAWHGHVDMVKLLVENGADLELLNDYKGTALGSAVHGSANCQNPTSDYIAVVELLIKSGAKVYDYMTQLGSESVSKVLRKAMK